MRPKTMVMDMPTVSCSTKGLELARQHKRCCGKVKNPGSVYLTRRVQGGRFSRVDLRNRLQDDPLVVVEDYGPEAAVLAEGQQQSFLWGLVAYERLDRWNLRCTEDAIQKAMAVEEPALSSILMKGQLYEAQGRPKTQKLLIARSLTAS